MIAEDFKLFWDNKMSSPVVPDTLYVKWEEEDAFKLSSDQEKKSFREIAELREIRNPWSSDGIFLSTSHK